MSMPAIKPEYLIGGAVLLAVVYVYTRGVKGVAKDVAGGAVDMADGVISGTVIGVGEVAGIPQTSMTECEKAKAEGRTWDASFACPAKDFLKYVFN